MQYRLIESFSNSTDPLFPLPATDNQIPVTRIPGKFEKDEKLRGTIPEFSEASENAKKEKVIPSWLKCTSRGKKITEEIGSIEKWGKIGLKFSDIIPDIREIKIRNFSFNISEKLNFTWKRDAWKRDPSRFFDILSYLILSSLQGNKRFGQLSGRSIKSSRNSTTEIQFRGVWGIQKERDTRDSRKWGFSPGTDIFTFILRPYRAALSHKHFLYRVRSNRGSKWYRFTENSRRRGHSFPL